MLNILSLCVERPCFLYSMTHVMISFQNVLQMQHNWATVFILVFFFKAVGCKVKEMQCVPTMLFFHKKEDKYTQKNRRDERDNAISN